MVIFQSTPSAWRVTDLVYIINFDDIISIHTLRMEGDEEVYDGTGSLVISIHTLRMEGDGKRVALMFNINISIHTLRMEGDVIEDSMVNIADNFNPHPPHGG